MDAGAGSGAMGRFAELQGDPHLCNSTDVSFGILVNRKPKRVPSAKVTELTDVARIVGSIKKVGSSSARADEQPDTKKRRAMVLASIGVPFIHERDG